MSQVFFLPCKSLSKQRTLTPLRTYSYKKHGGRGVLWLTRNPIRISVLSDRRESKDLSSHPTKHVCPESAEGGGVKDLSCYPIRKGARPSIPQVEELPHFAELLVPGINQIPDRLIRQCHQLPVQHFVQEPRRRFVVRMRAAFRLTNDFIHNPQLFQILGRNFHGCCCGLCFRRVPPDDRSAPFRRNHRIETIFQNVDAISDRNRQRSSRSAFPGHRHDHRHRKPRHLAQVPRDRLALPALFRVNSGIRARRIDQRNNWAAELRRDLHHAQRLPVAFWFWLAKIPDQALFRVAPLLMADDRHRAPVEFSQAGNNGFVVSVAAVPVQFDKICEEQIDKVQRVRPLLVPRDLRALPRPQVRVELAPEFRHLAANTLQLRVRIRVARQMPQLFDVLFQPLDLLLAVLNRRPSFVFFFGAHSATVAIERAPQICRTVSANSGVDLTLCFACSTATQPSGEHISNTTGHGPGEDASTSSRRSRISSLSACISSRTRNSSAAALSGSSSNRRASCNESRVPASSTCTRTFKRSGVPGFRTCSSRAKLSGNASSSCTPVISWIVKIAHRAPFFERIGRVPTISDATVISFPFRCSSTRSKEMVFKSCSREAYFARGWPET